MPKNIINPINRRLKKAEVKDYIDNHDATLHEEYTKFFFEDYGTGYVKKDFVYELPNGDFIYVFDTKGHITPGKGSYWEKDRFLRLVRSIERGRDDTTFGRTSSVRHWSFYSKHGSLLIHKSDQHLATISKALNIDHFLLDFSYHSLGRIDTEVEQLPYEKVWETLYDALVFYVGEVIIKRIDGKWAVEMIRNSEDDYPYVTVENTNIHYMPINIVYKEIDELNPCNLRKATADEIRTNAIWHPKNNK